MQAKMRIGTRDFALGGHTYIMGILNVTPDSFSDGGSYTQTDQALFHVEKMLSEGMDILDIGGESTRPGYTQLSADEEIDRVLPVLEAVKERFEIPVSLDTYKSAVAKAGVEAGADLLNDVRGLGYDAGLAGVAAQAEIPCILTHNRKEAVYQSLLREIGEDLLESVKIATDAGVRREQIILDPGIGFGKTCEQNLQVIRSLGELQRLGYPLLLGASRKSVIGLTLDLPVQERLEGTLVTTVYAVLSGCNFVRVHDVEANVRAVKMAEAIRDSFRQAGE